MSAKSQRRVAFANDITIIEFPMVIGDNPSVNCGAPVQIGWVPQATITRNLDMYEHFREENRRCNRDLILEVPQRLNILLRAGYPLEDIVAAAMAADVIQNSRIKNVKKQSWKRFNGIITKTGDILVSTSKTVKNIVVAPMRQRSVPAKE
jgi:hypothetical protein